MRSRKRKIPSVFKRVPILPLFEEQLANTKAALADAITELRKAESAGFSAAIAVYRDKVECLTDDLKHEESMLSGAKMALEIVEMHKSQQAKMNPRGSRPPKAPVKDKDFALVKAKEIWLETLSGIPEDAACRQSKALTKVLNQEFAPGKKIRQYWDKESLRKHLTRRKSDKSGATG